MKTIKLEITLEYDDDIMHGTEMDSIEWFRSEVLMGPPASLTLCSNVIGDEIGIVTVTKICEE